MAIHRTCDGINRRDFLRVGALGASGLTLSNYLRLSHAGEVKNAKALAFVVGGSQVFAKHVMHPAFVLPPHSFLRAALTDLAPDIIATLGDAVAAAVAS